MPGAASGGKRSLGSFARGFEGASASLQVERLAPSSVLGFLSHPGPSAYVESRFMLSFDFDRPWYEDRNGDKYCLLCHAFANEGHLTSTKHMEREQHPQWYTVEVVGVPCEEFNKPWFEQRNGDWYCLLCSAFATEGHLASGKHTGRESAPQHYGYPAAPGSTPVDAIPVAHQLQLYAAAVQPRTVPPEYQKPWFHFKEGDWYCTLCHAWATDGHLAGGKHTKRAAAPEWYMDISSSATAWSGSAAGPATYAPPLALAAGPAQPVASEQHPALPPPWERHFSDEHSKHYYYNRETAISTWDLPIQHVQTQAATEAAAAVPAYAAGVNFLPGERQVVAAVVQQPYTAAPTVSAPMAASLPTFGHPAVVAPSSGGLASALAAAAPTLPNGATMPSDDLPPGWARHWSEEHHSSYYHCPAEGKTQWEVPMVADPPPQEEDV